MDAEDRNPAAERLIGEISVQWGLLSSTDLVRAQWEVATRLARGQSVCLEQLLVQRRLVRSGELPDLIREAQYHDLRLVKNNERHFRRVPDLATANWTGKTG